MYEFQCGSPVCHSQFKAGDKEELKRQMAEHVRTAHRIPAPTASIQPAEMQEASIVLETAPVEVIDYAGIGGVYATLSKEQTSRPIGPEGFASVADALHRRAPNLPVAGIAGIDAGNAAVVIGAGADGIAVISALSLAPDPTAAARALREIVEGMLAKRGT